MAEQVKKSSAKNPMTEKEKEKLALQKQKEKEKAKQAAIKAKEKEKAKQAALKAKEKEKAKLALQKEKEKEKAKQAALKAKEKEKEKQAVTKSASSKSTTPNKSTPQVVEEKEKKVVLEKQESVMKKEVTDENDNKTPVKNDLNKLFETKKKTTEEVVRHEDALLADEKPSDHVAILRKKMEAQKKLKENQNSNPLEFNPLELHTDNNNESQLNEIISKLEETINLLTGEVKEKDALINKQDLEIKDKSDQILILTNSIVSKTNEADLVKEIDLLKKENENLKQELEEKNLVVSELKNKETLDNSQEVEETKEKNHIDINNPDIQEIIAQGDILLRIKLLNQRISEKESRIQLFEDELNKLTEADIQARDFKKEIKALRDNRHEFIQNTNNRLQELTELIKKDEAKLRLRKEEYEAKGKEIKDFDKKLSERKLTFTEKEKEMSIRSRIVAEYDSLGIKVNEIEEYFKKTITQYKNELASAERKVEELNNEENKLIENNLQKIREYKTSMNKDYKEDLETRSDLLAELDKLTLIYNEMKNSKAVEKMEADAVALDEMKKEYAKLTGKLGLIDSRYAERVNVEEVLRTIDPDVSGYLKAFEEREKLIFDINEINNKLKDESTDNLEHLELLVNDYQTRIKYLEAVISKSEGHEKVVFYKQLLKSMAELKDKEALIKARVNELKVRIDEMDNI